MVVVTVHPSIRKEAHEVNLASLFGFFESFNEHGVFEKLSLSNRFVDSGELLPNNSSGSYIQMPHF